MFLPMKVKLIVLSDAGLCMLNLPLTVLSKLRMPILCAIRYPMKSLPKSFTGRCSPSKFKTCERRQTVKSDRPGGFTPTSEVFLLDTKLTVRQPRRIKLLIRRLKALPYPFDPDDPCVQNSLEQAKSEWTKN